MAAVLAVLRRDLLREWQSRETVPSMVIFAALALFLFSIGAVPDRAGVVVGSFGPAVLWVTLFFSASIGVHRTFVAERENGALAGLLSAPIDRTSIYVGKLIGTWLFAAVMGAITLLGFIILYDPPLGALGYLGMLMAIAMVDYLAVGVLLSAMTHSLRGGEVLLRLLLLPLMIPVFLIAVKATRPLLAEGVLPDDAFAPVGAVAGFGAIYLAAGALLFEKVVEE